MMGEVRVYLHLALFILLYNQRDASPVGGHSSCETAGTVFEGEPATVTCHFHRSHEKFMIYRLSSSGESEIVTVCTHAENGPACDLVNGHTVATTGGRDQAVLHIPSAQQRSSGMYLCKTLPAKEDNANNCTLVVQSNTLRTGSLVTCKTNAPVSSGQQCLLTCEFAKIVGSTGIMLVKEHGSLSEETILMCNRDVKCEIKKDGYEIAEKTATHVAVSIPNLKTDYTGNYKCKSATLKGISHRCQLEMQVSADEKNAGAEESAYTIVILGTLVAVLVVIGIGGITFLIRKRRSCSRENTLQPPPEIAPLNQ